MGVLFRGGGQIPGRRRDEGAGGFSVDFCWGAWALGADLVEASVLWDISASRELSSHPPSPSSSECAPPPLRVCATLSWTCWTSRRCCFTRWGKHVLMYRCTDVQICGCMDVLMCACAEVLTCGDYVVLLYTAPSPVLACLAQVRPHHPLPPHLHTVTPLPLSPQGQFDAECGAASNDAWISTMTWCACMQGGGLMHAWISSMTYACAWGCLRYACMMGG